PLELTLQIGGYVEQDFYLCFAVFFRSDVVLAFKQRFSRFQRTPLPRNLPSRQKFNCLKPAADSSSRLSSTQRRMSSTVPAAPTRISLRASQQHLQRNKLQFSHSNLPAWRHTPVGRQHRTAPLPPSGGSGRVR